MGSGGGGGGGSLDREQKGSSFVIGNPKKN